MPSLSVKTPLVYWCSCSWCAH